MPEISAKSTGAGERGAHCRMACCPSQQPPLAACASARRALCAECLLQRENVIQSSGWLWVDLTQSAGQWLGSERYCHAVQNAEGMLHIACWAFHSKAMPLGSTPKSCGQNSHSKHAALTQDPQGQKNTLRLLYSQGQMILETTIWGGN